MIWEQVSKGWSIKKPTIKIEKIENEIETRLAELRGTLTSNKMVPSFLDDIYSDDEEDW
jgi:hypothetical protein